MSKEVSGAEILARSLAAQGIRMVFTVPTRRLEPLLQALAGLDQVKVVQARNETAAAIMADGYIRRSRLRAAVLTDAYGRALSQISGVTNAWADKIPLFALALCEDTLPDANKGIERSRFNQAAAFQAVTRWRTRLTSLDTIAGDIEKAAQESVSHRMGPVYIDIPMGLMEARIAERPGLLPAIDAGALKPIEPIRLAGDPDAIARATNLIMQARKPFVFCGGGVKTSQASSDLVSFLERFQIPVATSMAGMGCVPVSHPLSMGGPSYTAGEVFHVAIKEADVVIALGVAFGGLDGFGLPPLWSKDIAFIHVDIDPLQMGLNVTPKVCIQGDVKTVLKQLNDKLGAQGFSGKPEWGSWRGFLGNLKKGRAARLNKNANMCGDCIHQGKFAQEVGKLLSRDDLLMVIDGGNTPLYAAMYAPDVGPAQAFFPFGMAALGGGLPYAIGAQLASPEKRVVVATGDGSFMYNIQELETIRRLKLPIIILINNDSAWNMIRAMQYMLYARNYVGTDLIGIDYVRIAEGFGIRAERVTKAGDIVAAYDRARASGEAAVIECISNNVNLPDSLISFALVEFEGALKYADPVQLAKSLWMMRDLGLERMLYMMTYIKNALLRINVRARR